MKPWAYPLALLAALAAVALVPPWMHFVDTYAPTLPTEMQFLAQASLPLLVLLFLAGWLQPGGVRS